MPRMPRVTKTNKYDRRYKVTRFAEEQKAAVETDLRIYQIATFVMTIATLLAMANFFTK